LTVQQLEDKCLASDRHWALAVASECRLRNGSTVHIPMMDFRCKRNSQNLRKIIAALRRIHGTDSNARGHIAYVLESDHSYHSYGLQLLDTERWFQFLGQCLLLSPLTDSRYIAHCLQHGKSTLRVSTSSRHNKAPDLVAILESAPRS
jgi:hypothetical protein